MDASPNDSYALFISERHCFMDLLTELYLPVQKGCVERAPSNVVGACVRRQRGPILVSLVHENWRTSVKIWRTLWRTAGRTIHPPYQLPGPAAHAATPPSVFELSVQTEWRTMFRLLAFVA